MECEEREPSGGRAELIALAARRQRSRPAPPPITFNRRELHEILEIYGRKVANGEWRDYAIDQMKERAVFSIFRRSAETPLYRIVKQPRDSRRQGAYALVAATGRVVRHGHDLGPVLSAIDGRPRLVVA
jgi:hypothetical protein